VENDLSLSSRVVVGQHTRAQVHARSLDDVRVKKSGKGEREKLRGFDPWKILEEALPTGRFSVSVPVSSSFLCVYSYLFPFRRIPITREVK